LNLIKLPLSLLYHLGFIVGLTEGGPSNMVSKPGLEFEPRPRIFCCA
jgi:hypothetical protein